MSLRHPFHPLVPHWNISRLCRPPFKLSTDWLTFADLQVSLCLLFAQISECIILHWLKTADQASSKWSFISSLGSRDSDSISNFWWRGPSGSGLARFLNFEHWLSFAIVQSEQICFLASRCPVKCDKELCLLRKWSGRPFEIQRLLRFCELYPGLAWSGYDLGTSWEQSCPKVGKLLFCAKFHHVSSGSQSYAILTCL